MPHSFSTIRFSLRQKLTLFMSVLVIGACSSLSWYLIDQQTRAMEATLFRTGTLIAERLSQASRFSVISHDHMRLALLSEGALTIPEVIHVRFLGPTGSVIMEKQKHDSGGAPPTLALPTSTLPDFRGKPLITPYHRIQGEAQVVETYVTTADLILTAIGADHREAFFDVLQPLTDSSTESTLTPSLLDDLHITSRGTQTQSDLHQSIQGYIQICISTQSHEEELVETIRQVLWMTLLIILTALGMTILFAGHLVKPLQVLTSLTSRIAKGDLTATVHSTTNDEIGDLTQSFNYMVQALNQRDMVLDDQLQRLRTLNETSTTITSSLDPSTVLDSVLDLLVKNLGFHRTLLMRYDSQQQRAYDARVAGVSLEVMNSAQTISIPIHHDNSLLSEVILTGQKILVPDIESYAHRMDSQLYQLAKHMEATSFILVPLTSQNGIVGFAGACRGPTLCSQEDVELLSTIGSQVGVAIDNAQAYQQLEHMMETLEQRVQDRTTELLNANEKLKKLDQLKSTVVRSVSHELRTPLASIKMHVDNVLDGGAGPLQDEQKDYLTRVRNNTERLRRMINEMLDLSRIESGQTALHQTAVYFPEVLSEVVENLQPLTKPRSLDIEIQPHPELPPLWVDEDKLHQILMNLIHNAVKFSSKHGTIRITTTVEQDSVVVCVLDHGSGVSAEEIEHIFLPFYRSPAANFQSRGAGLGLAIAKSLIEMHGGTLWVQSIVDQGSQFYFTLPLASVPVQTSRQGSP